MVYHITTNFGSNAGEKCQLILLFHKLKIFSTCHSHRKTSSKIMPIIDFKKIYLYYILSFKINSCKVLILLTEIDH